MSQCASESRNESAYHNASIGLWDNLSKSKTTRSQAARIPVLGS